jgi:beta-N-acetylhexosaminidase
MKLEQLAGQLLWCGWGDAPEPAPRRYNDHARILVEEIGVGGLVLFTRNLGTPTEIAELTGELRRHAAVPLLIGIDQEGGRVSRLPLPGMVFPGNMALGLIDDLDLTRLVMRSIGEQLAALGIDVDFAPSVDVNNNPHNPIIGVRSFGDDPDLVGRHGVAAVAGFGDAGILPVIKHFPGHGDTGQDSHLELPTLAVERSRLDIVELPPFAAALVLGAPAVMSTHILFPALDPELPSTLSRRILTGILREELGFQGLIVTDCLEMKGIADHWGPEEAAVLALEAGADMLLVCHTLDTQLRMHAAVCQAVRSGRLSEERLRQSAARVQRARARVAPVREGERRPDRVSAVYYRDLETRVADDALALIADAPRALPPIDRTAPVFVGGVPVLAQQLTEALQAHGVPASAFGAPGEVPDSGARVVWIVLPHDPFPDGRPPDKLLAWLRGQSEAVIVSAREPYCLAHYPEHLPRIAAWGALPVHLDAVARALSGERSAPLRPLRLPSI